MRRDDWDVAASFLLLLVSVKIMGKYAFRNCSSLANVYQAGTATEQNSISVAYEEAAQVRVGESISILDVMTMLNVL